MQGLYLHWGKRVVTPQIREMSAATLSSPGSLRKREQILYATWVYPLHSSEGFERAVTTFVKAFNVAWKSADEAAQGAARGVIREMLELEVEFTELLSTSE